MFGNVFRKSHVRYALNRWVLPRLGNEPLGLKNLSQRAWPKVAALTAAHAYADQIESIEWTESSDSDGTELLEQYALTSRPVLLKGYATSSVEARWTIEWVRAQVGSMMVEIRVGDYASAPGEPEQVLMRLADFVDYLLGQAPFPYPERLADGKGPYLGNKPIPTLDQYLPSPRFLSERPSSNYWLGSAGSCTPLHCHQHGDFLVFQLIGHRRFVLIPPHEALLVGYMPVNMNICTAAFDPFAPDQEQFPGAIHRLYGDLEPGDALLLPGFWFHAVQITEPSMSATRSRKSMPAVIGGGPVQSWRSRPYSRGW